MKLFPFRSTSADRAVEFHIGTHKTGTTTIQEFLRINKARLRQAGLARVFDDTAVTDTREQRAAHKICEALAAGEKSPNWERLRAAAADLRADMPVLLSSEVMFRHLSAARTEGRRRSLSDNIRATLGERVRFTLYVRNFGDYFNSLVSERIIATTESRPFAEVVKGLGHLAAIQDVAEHLEADFGPGSVRIHSFDAATRSEGGLLAHFARGFGWTAEAGLEEPGGRLHAMPPPATLAAKYVLNGLDLAPEIYARLRRQIPKITLAHGKGKPFRVISDEMIDEAIAMGRRLNPGIGRFGDIPEDLLYSDQAKAKPYVDLAGLPPERKMAALAEFYQLSTLGDVKRLKVLP